MTLSKFNIQEVIMRKYMVLLAASFIVLNVECLDPRPRIKPNPDKNNFQRCPVCKGTGVIEVESAHPSRDDSDLADQEYSLIRDIFMKAPGPEEKFDMETNRSIERPGSSSGFKYHQKCGYCEGIGWVRIYPEPGTSISEHNKLDDIIEANEQLNKGLNKPGHE